MTNLTSQILKDSTLKIIMDILGFFESDTILLKLFDANKATLFEICELSIVRNILQR